MDRLKFYNIDDKYIDYLYQFDDKVPYNKNQKRPYIGVIIDIDNIKYFAPLFSPKSTHKKYSDNPTYIKIGQDYGIIRFNNMIPVVGDVLTPIDFNLIKDIKYKNLLMAQNNFIQQNTEKIRNVANKLYKMVTVDKKKFNEARIRDIVDKNPFDLKGYIMKPKSSKPTKEIDALTVEEEERFIKELDKGYDDYTIVFYIAIYTGMRISEILALKREDIDFENKKIYVRKTLSHVDKGRILLENTTKTYAGMRDVPILNALYDKLLEYKIDKKRGFLFLKNGNFIHATSFNSRFQKLCKNADIRVYKKKVGIKGGRKTKTVYQCNITKSKVNTHMLRHTFATRCIENGVSPVVLQRILGHKDIQVTLNTYTSVFHEFKEKEIEKINSIF